MLPTLSFKALYLSISLRSGAVHVKDRILSINDVLVKDEGIKNVYQMLDYSGEVVKLRLQSIDGTRSKKGSDFLEIPDMTSLHRVSAWAEIFSELDQIVSSSTPAGCEPRKGPANEDETVKDDGTCIEASAGQENTGVVLQRSENESGTAESDITASVCSEVKSGGEDFWEDFDALWEMTSVGEKSKTDCGKNLKTANESKACLQSPSEKRSVETTFPRTGDDNKDDHDSTSGILKGKSISVRYVVHEKCVNPGTTENTPVNSLERSPSVASGYETDCSAQLRGSANDVPLCGRMSRTDTEPFASMDSFDISNDAEDKIPLSARDKLCAQSPEVFETRVFSVQKSDEHGFGFSLMPDKFKQEVYIASVLPGGPCDGMLQPLDKITKVCFNKGLF